IARWPPRARRAGNRRLRAVAELHCLINPRIAPGGIRLALGADSGDVRRMVIGQGMRLAGAGVVVGLIVAFGLARLIARLLYGVTPRDPMVFAGAPIVLRLVSLVAVWLPAIRAVGIDPVIALRAE